MNTEKYLPIGTVVMLRGGTKRAMITGFCAISENDLNNEYDYSGCLYPEGFVSTDQILLFNHDQIDKIYYMGLSDDEDKKFKVMLNDAMNKIESGNQENN